MAKTATHRTNLSNAPTYIGERLDFDCNGTLTGRTESPTRSAYRGSIGSLSGAWLERLYREEPTYVVYSYATPIAWWSEAHGWSKPDRRYSVTTSRHQGCCPQNQSIG